MAPPGAGAGTARETARGTARWAAPTAVIAASLALAVAAVAACERLHSPLDPRQVVTVEVLPWEGPVRTLTPGVDSAEIGQVIDWFNSGRDPRRNIKGPTPLILLRMTLRQGGPVYVYEFGETAVEVGTERPQYLIESPGLAGYLRDQKERALAALAIERAFESPHASGEMFSGFPREPGTREVVIQGGGPDPGVSLPGSLSTEVRREGNGFVVTLTERWWRPQDPSKTWGHTWEFTVNPAGEVGPPASAGDIPPQLWR